MFARVVRSRYLVSFYIFYVLLNVRDKNPLYGRCFGSGKTLSGYLHKSYAEIGPHTS